jgi:hypothetical protein
LQVGETGKHARASPCVILLLNHALLVFARGLCFCSHISCFVVLTAETRPGDVRTETAHARMSPWIGLLVRKRSAGIRAGTIKPNQLHIKASLCHALVTQTRSAGCRVETAHIRASLSLWSCLHKHALLVFARRLCSCSHIATLFPPHCLTLTLSRAKNLATLACSMR